MGRFQDIGRIGPEIAKILDFSTSDVIFGHLNAFQKVFLKMAQKRLDRAKLSTRFGAAAAKR